MPRGTRHEGLVGRVLICRLVPLEQVPLAGSTPLKGRQAEFYKYQSGRRRTANSEASPNQANRRTALYSPRRGWPPNRRPRERSPEPLVLARFWLLLPRGKSNRRVRGREAPGVAKRKTQTRRAAPQIQSPAARRRTSSKSFGCISGYVQFPSRGSSSRKISSISLCSSPKEETSA